jgi:hypothetical protein
MVLVGNAAAVFPSANNGRLLPLPYQCGKCHPKKRNGKLSEEFAYEPKAHQKLKGEFNILKVRSRMSLPTSGQSYHF